MSENLRTRTSPLPSALGSVVYSACFIQNQKKSQMRVINIPRTSNLNLFLVIRSVLNIMYKAVTQIVRLKKSGLINITRIVRPVYIQRSHHVSINHGTLLYPALLANVFATSSILASSTFSYFSTASNLAAIYGGKSQLVKVSDLCSSASFILSSARDFAFYCNWKP